MATISNPPSQNQLHQVLILVGGFRFQLGKGACKSFQQLLTCGDFTTSPPTPQNCSLAEYAVRFENNASVLVKALIFFRSFWGTQEFFGIVQKEIPNLVRNPSTLAYLQNVLRTARARYLNSGGISQSSTIINLVDEWARHVPATGACKDPKPQMQPFQWRALNNCTKVAWEGIMQDGSLVDAGRSLYTSDVSRYPISSSEADTSPPISTPSDTVPSEGNSDPASDESQEDAMESDDESVVFVRSVKTVSTKKRRGTASSDQSPKRRATGDRQLPEGSSPSVRRSREKKESRKTPKEVTSGQGQRMPTPVSESSTFDFRSSPPCSLSQTAPTIERHRSSDRHKSSGRSKSRSEKRLDQGTVAALESRTSELERIANNLQDRVKNKQQYVLKTVKEQLAAVEPGLLEKVAKKVKPNVADQLVSRDEAIAKKQRKLEKRISKLEEKFKGGLRDMVKSLVSQQLESLVSQQVESLVSQEIEKVRGQVKFRDLEKIPLMEKSLEGLSGQMQLLDGQVQSLGTIGDPSVDTTHILQRLEAVEKNQSSNDSDPSHYTTLGDCVAEQREALDQQGRLAAMLRTVQDSQGRAISSLTSKVATLGNNLAASDRAMAGIKAGCQRPPSFVQPASRIPGIPHRDSTWQAGPVRSRYF